MKLEQLLRDIEVAEDRVFTDYQNGQEDNKGWQMLRTICLALVGAEILDDSRNSAINCLIIKELSTLFEEDQDVVSLPDLQEITEKEPLVPGLFGKVTAFFERLSPVSVVNTSEYQPLPNVCQ